MPMSLQQLQKSAKKQKNGEWTTTAHGRTNRLALYRQQNIKSGFLSLSQIENHTFKCREL